MMFTMDMSYEAPQNTPVVLTQAANMTGTANEQGTLGRSQKANYVILACQEVSNERDSDPTSAEYSMNPAGLIRILMRKNQQNINENAINVQVLTGPKYGILSPQVANNGQHFFVYHPNPGYFGKDQVTFFAELAGKFYKLVLTVAVKHFGGDTDDFTVCDPLKVIKVSGLVEPSNYMISFTDLIGDALGQTTGEGFNR